MVSEQLTNYGITAAVLFALVFVIWAKLKEKNHPIVKTITEKLSKKKEDVKTKFPELPSAFTQDQKIM